MSFTNHFALLFGMGISIMLSKLVGVPLLTRLAIFSGMFTMWLAVLIQILVLR